MGVLGFFAWDSSEYGYSAKHHQMYQSKSNPSGRHTYLGRPKQINWKITPVIDGGKVRFFTGLAPINEIDAVSSVPSIRHGIKIYSASKRILDTSSAWRRVRTPTQATSTYLQIWITMTILLLILHDFRSKSPKYPMRLDSTACQEKFCQTFSFLKKILN